ncbi:MAG: diadenosine tetraphosphate hydrolase [Euryarchaeota archaeon]|nr:diadenosine tetraphosphate hydrolase [Euryarchaeota archaeon]|tara:strand:+ start:6569 stop:6964 length:396 start_codon:yes stop_codon:yes gene_type:complete
METSCGVVLVNLDSVLILQYPQGHWDLPKGHVEKSDEDHKQTALRELTEETGISKITWIDGFSKKTEYSFTKKGKEIHKTVWWLLAKTSEINVELSEEHQNYLWLDWDSAINQVTHELTKSVILSARKYIE